MQLFMALEGNGFNMSVDIDSIIRRVLVRYPSLGSIIARIEFKEENVQTAETDGKTCLYNPEFINSLSKHEQVFVFAHETCHIALEHIYRAEGKDEDTWNIATDAVINDFLNSDGLPKIKGCVDMKGASDCDAEEIYNRLLKDENKQNYNTPQNHDLWKKAIDDKKKEEENTKQEGKQQNSEQKESESPEQSEKEFFKKLKEERKASLKKLREKLAEEASKGAGNEQSGDKKTLTDIGIAAPLIDWRKLLRQAIKYEEEYTRKYARMRDGFFKYRIQEIPIPETEIALDISDSVSEILLKNFLRECKNIIDTSRVKVGGFNTQFHGFTEIRR